MKQRPLKWSDPVDVSIDHWTWYIAILTVLVLVFLRLVGVL